MKRRASGILLHITSLPSRFGIGDLGPEAYRFVDFLSQTKQSYWQILPVTPTDPASGNSPYSRSPPWRATRFSSVPSCSSTGDC